MLADVGQGFLSDPAYGLRRLGGQLRALTRNGDLGSRRRTDELREEVLQRSELATQRGQGVPRLVETVARHAPRRHHALQDLLPACAPLDQQPGRLQVHELRGEAVCQHVVDLRAIRARSASAADSASAARAALSWVSNRWALPCASASRRRV